jgi:CubicO group peptidase (beta-lactamase class C family)
MAKVQGTCDPKFEKVRTLFQEMVETGEEDGAGITASIDGKIVIDIWGGYQDPEKTKTWDKDTIVNVWSSTKTIAALAVLMCHDRGLLSVDDPVAKIWPEFGQNGKEDIKIKNLLSHTSGVSGWDKPITIEEICDVKTSTEKLAKQKPWWDDRSVSGYHALTMGHLLGECVRRVTGKSLKQFVKEEIADPLGADFQIGALEKDWDRVATLTAPPPPPPPETPPDPEGVAMKTFTGPAGDPKFALTPMWRNAEIGGANGHGNARSMNKIMSCIPLGGTVDGHKLLSQATIDRIFEVQCDGQDLCLPLSLRFGIGYGLVKDENMFGLPAAGKKMCYWAGWGGSIVMMDLTNKSIFTYAMNKMAGGTTGSPRTLAYMKAYYDALAE